MSNDRVVLDLSGSEDATKAGGGSFDALPNGWYQAVIYSVELRKTGPNSKTPGKPFYNIRLNITQEGEFYKRVVFDGFVGLYTTEAAPFLAQKAEQLSRVAGVWDGEDRSNVTIATPDDLQGLEVEAFIKKERDKFREDKYEEENGEESPEPIFTNRVNAYRPVGGWPDAETLASAKAGGGKKKAQKVVL